ncbi:DUF6522 family protein [Luteimonas sp. M1R5S18]|uniref:DUF6522 family protein n=1 Tax=Luteimonas rhizosphaericola TaxID=3042024 RepID=A0ABT6JFB9_9GAMM|nr:DUF6522 family protein [Luteimonas rhizosphaericola]MDH5829375.1 DUF6522 family protein [Luteimonas rhizosphaericola]
MTLRTIPIAVADAPEVEIDAALVARGLGLAPEAFRRLMDTHRIAVLCERGTGVDAGLYRASFYHGQRRVRLVVDRDGALQPHSCEVTDLPRPMQRRGRHSHGDGRDPA